MRDLLRERKARRVQADNGHWSFDEQRRCHAIPRGPRAGEVEGADGTGSHGGRIIDGETVFRGRPQRIVRGVLVEGQEEQDIGDGERVQVLSRALDMLHAV